ncbi:hypothetical protein MF271_04960 [Deinococcus sp. KNUC1210]|uniref:hypothetical protein n=1 Tax=Deinococcus sp. KNUC1210 TaxID=2917691 RepID=UPI001EEFFF45|nr:hypothetical protein [Deinococcus sp. KNUC1210]ULH15985.1 hypothetical protein MF271_04960 [Deinococcus sp. KNUC1210]
MKRLLLALMMVGGPLLILAAPLPHPPPIYCPVIVYRDYDLMFSYYAQFRLPRDCPTGGIARIRKSSTVSTKAQGNPYEPINPQSGAWEVYPNGIDTVPDTAQLTFNSWQWQYWDGLVWQSVEPR